jgi:hypothetical protein
MMKKSAMLWYKIKFMDMWDRVVENCTFVQISSNLGMATCTAQKGLGNMTKT